MKLRCLCSLLIGLLLIGCQSARVPTLLPESTGYGRVTTATPASRLPDAAPPELSASLSASEAEPTTPITPTARPKLAPAPVVPLPTLTAAPDTALERLLRPDPVIKPDPLTSGVNVLGALSTIGGLGFLFAAFNYDGSGFLGLAFLLYSLPLLAIGIPLLLFQGKNGRRRKHREARAAAKHPGTEPAHKSEDANRPLKRLGLGMLIAGGLVLLLGLMGGIGGAILVSFLGLPIAVIGAILLIAGS